MMMYEQLTNNYLPGPQLVASNYVPGTVRTITVAGANLFELALKYLGRAQDWNRIAALNDLWDPVVIGVVTLKIPPYDIRAGNGGILGI